LGGTFYSGLRRISRREDGDKKLTSSGQEKNVKGVYEVEVYATEDGRLPFWEWYTRLRDARAKLAIRNRITRARTGNLGDHKYCRDGVWELRIDFGPGFRLYYAVKGKTLLLLLCGGDKGTQSGDISRACEFWKQNRGEDDAKRKL
jgi:putative addiction module killer protein